MSTVNATREFDDTPVLRVTVYALAGGTFLLSLGVAALVWVWGTLAFVGSVTSLVGILAVTLVALLLFALGWALLTRGLTEIIARGVAEGMAR